MLSKYNIENRKATKSKENPFAGTGVPGWAAGGTRHENLSPDPGAAGLSAEAAEPLVHDVLNVFMCTGFTRDTHQYFMKASPVRPGDFLEFFAEIDLLGALSTCPGGDCSSEHSSDTAVCYPLKVEIFKPEPSRLSGWQSPKPSGYDRSHGLEKKSLTQKQEDPENRLKLLVSLSALGNMAYWADKHWHETMDGGFIKYLESLNSDQIAFLLDFLTRVEDFLQRRIASTE